MSYMEMFGKSVLPSGEDLLQVLGVPLVSEYLMTCHCRASSTLTTCCTMCGSRTSTSTLSTLPPPSSTSHLLITTWVSLKNKKL